LFKIKALFTLWILSILICLNSCGNRKQDISFEELQKLNINYFHKISAGDRGSAFYIFFEHGDSCKKDLLWLKKSWGKLEFKTDSIYRPIENVCDEMNCKLHDINQERLNFLYQFFEKYYIEVSSLCHIDSNIICFNGNGYRYIYSVNSSYPHTVDMQRLNKNWWFDKSNNQLGY
jgi:hypothetical protein